MAEEFDSQDVSNRVAGVAHSSRIATAVFGLNRSTRQCSIWRLRKRKDALTLLRQLR